MVIIPKIMAMEPSNLRFCIRRPRIRQNGEDNSAAKWCDRQTERNANRKPIRRVACKRLRRDWEVSCRYGSDPLSADIGQ